MEPSSPDPERLLGPILAALDALVVVFDDAGRIVVFNAASERLSGYRADEVRGRLAWELLVAPDDVEAAKAAVAEGRAGNPFRHTTAWVTRGGERRLINWSNTAMQGADGSARFIVATGIDITARQLSERALEADEARLRAIAETCPDGIVTIDIEGTVGSFSAAAARMFGYGAAEVVGRNVDMLMPEPYRRQHDGYLARYRDTGERRIIGIGRLVSGRRKDGSTFPLELSVGEANADGRRVFVGFLRDVSVRQETLRRVQELQVELERTSRLTAAEGLSSAIAHELTQPLTASVTYLQACRQLIAQAGDGPVPARALGMLEKAAGQNLRAGEIVRRMRELVMHGEADRKPEDINRIVEEAVSLVVIGVESDRVHLTFELAEALQPVFVDRVQIQQVVVNLARNAIESMADSATRQLTIRTHRVVPEGVAVSIRDTGPGLDEAVRARLFQPFASTKATGLGLGLAISRSIIENHGGRLSADSNPDGGTVFSFTLPA
jgi:two-component system sensor kinase FixL